LFSIQDRHIQNKNFNENLYHDYHKNDNQQENDNDGGISPPNEPIEGEKTFFETFGKIDNEYEKKFGRLYKTFDVRVIKNKIWDTISVFKENNIKTTVDFKQIIGSVSNNLSREVLYNISTPTCFVCLLHLSNEKSKIINLII